MTVPDCMTIQGWREFCRSHELEGSRILFETSDEEIKAFCNGIGSEAMPKWSREFLDRLHPSMRIAAAIHDLEYALLEDRSDQSFRECNARFQRNCATVVKVLYGWYDPRRYFAIYKSKQFAAVLDLCGKPAWKKARKDYLKREKKSKRLD